MFKRVRWMGLGAVLGVSGTVWLQLKLRRTAQRYLLPEIGSRVADRARGFGDEVRGAVTEGRHAMQEREAELRARIGPMHALPPVPPPDPLAAHKVPSRPVVRAIRPSGTPARPAARAVPPGSPSGSGDLGARRRRPGPAR
jgi:hypothetical protein